MRPGEAVGDLSFATLYRRARARGEVALGVMREGAEQPELNPPKLKPLKLKPTDQLVVLGEAF